MAGLLAKAGFDAVASLAGETRTPLSLPMPTRQGGFGGEASQERYFVNNGISVVIDATHPFAAQISTRTARIASRLNLPCLHLVRPPWKPVKDDLWTDITSGQDAADFIPEGATVFLATGRKTLAEFENLRGRRLICRQIDPPQKPFPFDNGEYLIGRPPFSVEDEVDLFKTLGVDWLVVKNAGGKLSSSKLDAARILRIPVLMIARPPMPKGDYAKDAKAAMNWLKGLNESATQ